MKYLIDDVRAGNKAKPLVSFSEVAMLCACTLTEALLHWPDWCGFNPKTTLLVFPGNGAATLRGYLPPAWLQQWRWATVAAKRFWAPGEDPVVTAGRIYPRGFIIGIKDIVILDDVISSGKTMKLIRQLNDPWIPGSRWHAVAWVRQRAASLRGFVSSFAASAVGTPTTKVPVNSLSTFLAAPEIAASYARRHFPESPAFLHFLEGLRRI